MCSVAAAQCESVMCPGSQEGELRAGVHQTQHKQLPSWDGYPTVLSSGLASASVLGPTILNDVKILECVQRRTKKLDGMACKEKLRTLGLSGLDKRRLRGDLIAL